MEDERDLKTKIVSKAKELQELIFSCNDDDFVDSVVTALKYNSYIEDEDLDDGNNYYGDSDYDTEEDEEDSYDFDCSLDSYDEEDEDDEDF